MAVRKQPTIVVPPYNVERLAKANNASRTATYQALRYATFSDKAEKIRQDAVKFYGGVKTSKTVVK